MHAPAIDRSPLFCSICAARRLAVRWCGEGVLHTVVAEHASLRAWLARLSQAEAPRGGAAAEGGAGRAGQQQQGRQPGRGQGAQGAGEAAVRMRPPLLSPDGCPVPTDCPRTTPCIIRRGLGGLRCLEYDNSLVPYHLCVRGGSCATVPGSRGAGSSAGMPACVEGCRLHVRREKLTATETKLKAMVAERNNAQIEKAAMERDLKNMRGQAGRLTKARACSGPPRPPALANSGSAHSSSALACCLTHGGCLLLKHTPLILSGLLHCL